VADGPIIQGPGGEDGGEDPTDD